MNTNTLASLLPGYIEHLKTSALAERTGHTYISHTRHLVRVLGSERHVAAAITKASLKAFIAEYAKDHRPRSVYGRLVALRHFCDYLVTEGRLEENPALHIDPPVLDDPHRETPTDEEVLRLLEGCSRLVSDYRCRLARAVIATVAFAGMRRAELLGIRVQDVNLKAGEIHLT